MSTVVRAALAALLGLAADGAAPRARTRRWCARCRPTRRSCTTAPRTCSCASASPSTSARARCGCSTPTGRRSRRRRPRTPAAIPATAVLTLPAGLETAPTSSRWRVTSADSHPVSGAFSFSRRRAQRVVRVGSTGPSERRRGVRRDRARDRVPRARAGGRRRLRAARCSGRRARPRGAGGACLGWASGALAGGHGRGAPAPGPVRDGGSLPALAAGVHALHALRPCAVALSTRFAHALRASPRVGLIALSRARLVGHGPCAAPSRDRASCRGRRLCAAAGMARDLDAHRPLAHRRAGVARACPRRPSTCWRWRSGSAASRCCWRACLRRPDRRSSRSLPRFSRLALACFAALGVTGVYLAWRQSGTLAALPATDFGKLLLIAKSAIVLAIVGLAALSRRVPRAAAAIGAAPAADGRGRSRARRRRARRDRDAGQRRARAGGLRAAGRRSAAGRRAAAACRCTSSRPSRAPTSPTSTCSQRDGGLVVPQEVGARLQPPGGDDLGPLPVELAPAEPGHYVASRLTVPFPGRWTLKLAVRTSEIDEDVIDIPVRIR